jgi:hypothetical protein
MVLFIVCLTVWENTGRPENYTLMMKNMNSMEKGKKTIS